MSSGWTGYKSIQSLFFLFFAIIALKARERVCQTCFRHRPHKNVCYTVYQCRITRVKGQGTYFGFKLTVWFTLGTGRQQNASLLIFWANRKRFNDISNVTATA